MMDKKDIISKLAGYKLEGDIEGREKTIELGYEIMIRLGMSRHSYFELFLSTFRFIHVHTWIIQLFIFLSGITMALDLLIQVGLDDVKNKKIRKYSGGMKQRLGIAQAMINNPEILILDEPTVGLDPKERVKFRKLISSFASEKIVLLSTHIVSDIEYIADEIIILKKGRIENTGTIRYLLKDINKCVWECLVPEKEVNRIEQVYTVSNRKYGEDGVVLRLISREKPFANAKQVDPVLEDLYLFYFREGE